MSTLSPVRGPALETDTDVARVQEILDEMARLHAESRGFRARLDDVLGGRGEMNDLHAAAQCAGNRFIDESTEAALN